MEIVAIITWSFQRDLVGRNAILITEPAVVSLVFHERKYWSYERVFQMNGVCCSYDSEVCRILNFEQKYSLDAIRRMETIRSARGKSHTIVGAEFHSTLEIQRRANVSLARAKSPRRKWDAQTPLQLPILHVNIDRYVNNRRARRRGEFIDYPPILSAHSCFDCT